MTLFSGFSYSKSWSSQSFANSVEAFAQTNQEAAEMRHSFRGHLTHSGQEILNPGTRVLVLTLPLTPKANLEVPVSSLCLFPMKEREDF